MRVFEGVELTFTINLDIGDLAVLALVAYFWVRRPLALPSSRNRDAPHEKPPEITQKTDADLEDLRKR